jgi:DUF971 family protein
MVPPPANILVIGDELAISWKDGSESYLKLQDVRRLCPCASCAGERDLFGRLAKPPQSPYTPQSFEVAGSTPVGSYALQIHWKDGHGDGLYPWVRLKEWAENRPELPPLAVRTLLPTL